MSYSTIGSVSWADRITFADFLKQEAKCAVTLIGVAYEVRYYCMNPKVPSAVIYHTQTVSIADNPFVHVERLTELMQKATAALYNVVSDSDGELCPPETPMLYHDCFMHTPIPIK
jgi:hypothetical protein